MVNLKFLSLKVALPLAAMKNVPFSAVSTFLRAVKRSSVSGWVWTSNCPVLIAWLLYPKLSSMFLTLTELFSCAWVSDSLVAVPSLDIPNLHPTPSKVALKNNLKASTTLIFVEAS